MNRAKKAILILFWAAAVNIGIAQNRPWTKPYTAWSAEDAEKILNDSPWAQKQILSDTNRIVWDPGHAGSNQIQHTNHWIRFLSARPIRQALFRSLELNRKATRQEIEVARTLMEKEYASTIVVAVTYGAADPQYNIKANTKFSSATTSLLKNRTYLELDNGRRIFLQEYERPGPDGLGAKFIFPRLADGQPLISIRNRIVRFVGMGLNIQFKVEDLLFNGWLEY